MLSTRVLFPSSNKMIVSRNFTSITTHAPYKTKEIFIRETQGAFRLASNNGDPKYYLPHRGTIEDIREMSWSIYQASIQSEMKGPAILYTGADYNIVHPIKDQLVPAGRLYAPLHHIWSANATWLLSQAHKKREIISLSDPIYTFSAFTRELVCIFRAGYRITSTTYIFGGRIVSHLTPPPDGSAFKLNLFDLLTVTQEDCVIAQRKFNEEKKELLKQSPSKMHHNLLKFLHDDCHKELRKKETYHFLNSSNINFFKQKSFIKKDPITINTSKQTRSFNPSK